MKDLRLQDLKRIETAVIAVALLFVLVWLFLNQQVAAAKSDLEIAQRKLAATRGDFNRLNSGEEKAALDKQLQVLQAGQGTVILPPKSDALNFGAELSNYVSVKRLDLQTLESKDATVNLNKLQRPAIAYSIVAKGSSQDLVGTLSLLNRFSTAIVQNLSLSKDKDGLQWKLSLSVAVAY